MEYLGKYLILGELGRGGMGVVFLAQDPDLDRKVALKVLQEDLSTNSEFLLGLEHEARAVAKLFHPNILPVNALCRHGDRLLLEMPYVETGSLADLLVQRGQHCPEAVIYCAQVLDALAACHANDIVHRDVKPSNILLDPQGRALLSDFGLARAMHARLSGMSSRGTTSAFVGTPRYAPLEAWDGGIPSPAWDLFSVGVILHESLSGERLVESDSFLGYLRALEKGDWPRLADIRQCVSEPMSELVQTLLDPDPSRRPGNAGEVLAALTATSDYNSLCANVDTTQAKFPGHRTRLRVTGLRRPRRLLWPLLLAVALLAVLGGVLLLAERGLFTSAADQQFGTTPASVPAAMEEGDIFDVAYLLAQSRTLPPEQGLTFAATVAGRPDLEGHCVLVRDEDGAFSRGLYFTDLQVAGLTFQADDDGQYGVEGFWGAFTGYEAVQNTSGEVAGMARWLSEDSTLWMALTYTSQDEALRWKESATLTRSDETDTASLWRLENSDYLVPLVRNELVPRRQEWQTLCKEWLPALPEAYLVLVDLRGAGEAPDWEHAWKQARAHAVPAWPRDSRASMVGILADDGVRLRLSIPGGLGDAWSLEVAMRTALSLPQGDSREFTAEWDGGEWQNGIRSEHGRQQSWQPDWVVSTLQDGDASTLELFVSAGSLEGGGGSSGSTGPWRLNAMLTERMGSNSVTPRLYWGTPETQETQHGMVLEFPSP